MCSEAVRAQSQGMPKDRLHDKTEGSKTTDGIGLRMAEGEEGVEQ